MMNNFNFEKLEKELDVKFNDKELLTKAFCHRSFLNENPEFELGCNERLEFLGDAVLELIVTEFLFKEYPKEPEGKLTKWRASLVKTKSLSELAKELNFNDYLLLSRGEQKETGRSREFILADTFEAFIGAFFLDKGLKSVKKFVRKNLLIKLDKIIEEGLYRDPKSTFQEKAQEAVGITPTYEVKKEWGPDHAKKFEVVVKLKEKEVEKAIGASKQEAEEKAAKKALKKNINNLNK